MFEKFGKVKEWYCLILNRYKLSKTNVTNSTNLILINYKKDKCKDKP